MDMTAPPPALALPKSQAEIDRIHSERKRFVFERCRESRFHGKRLAGIDPARLDDPAEWAKIPILDKDELRGIPADRFFDDFCMAPREDICELWRSGGATGVPLFYPRSFLDMRYGLLSFARAFELVGVGRGDTAHISFPLGIHPVGHAYGRAAQTMGIGVNWAGSGAGTPSALQVDLVQRLRPTIWMGMSSYGLHLANLAEAQGVDLTRCGVKRLMTSAEPLSDAKRAKLERMWGAKVYDTFGMTEAGLMGCESDAHDGFHVWTDMYLIEVVDPDSKQPVPEGEVGSLIVTPLWTSHATPFIRWAAGDLVSLKRKGAAGGPFNIFPLVKHAHRTAGFFKVRGVNINHSEFEDFMFRFAEVSDFKAEIVTIKDLDTLRLSFEVKRDADPKATAAAVAAAVKRTFEVSPEIVVLDRGSLAREFEGAVKAPRFQDRRA